MACPFSFADFELALRSEDELARLSRFAGAGANESFIELLDTPIGTRIVPDAVVKRISNAEPKPREAMILGTPGTNSIYRTFSAAGIAVTSLNEAEYRAIDKAIVASIGGDSEHISKSKRTLADEVIGPRNAAGLIIVEACTDFRFGLGYSSLALFAEAMIDEIYDDVLGAK